MALFQDLTVMFFRRCVPETDISGRYEERAEGCSGFHESFHGWIFMMRH